MLRGDPLLAVLQYLSIDELTDARRVSKEFLAKCVIEFRRRGHGSHLQFLRFLRAERSNITIAIPLDPDDAVKDVVVRTKIFVLTYNGSIFVYNLNGLMVRQYTECVRICVAIGTILLISCHSFAYNRIIVWSDDGHEDEVCGSPRLCNLVLKSKDGKFTINNGMHPVDGEFSVVICGNTYRFSTTGVATPDELIFKDADGLIFDDHFSMYGTLKIKDAARAEGFFHTIEARIHGTADEKKTRTFEYLPQIVVDGRSQYYLYNRRLIVGRRSHRIISFSRAAAVDVEDGMLHIWKFNG